MFFFCTCKEEVYLVPTLVMYIDFWELRQAASKRRPLFPLGGDGQAAWDRRRSLWTAVTQGLPSDAFIKHGSELCPGRRLSSAVLVSPPRCLLSAFRSAGILGYWGKQMGTGPLEGAGGTPATLTAAFP